MEMKRKLLFPIIIAIILIIFSVFPAPVHADTGTLSVSDSSPYIGSTITVTLSFSGSYQGLEGSLTYDPSVVKYLSSQSSGVSDVYGGSGTLSYGLFQTPGTMYLSFNFKVIGPGTCTFTADSTWIIGSDGSSNAGAASASISASKAPAPAKPSKPSKPSTSKPSKPSKPAAPAPKEEEDTSSDAYLSAIDISVGSLSPSFSPDVFEYKVYAGKDADYCSVTATARSAEASVDISGESDLSSSETERIITVTAPDGTQNEYRVIVLKEDPPKEKDKNKSKNLIEIDGKKYSPISKPDLKALPEGFEETKVKYKGKELNAAKSKDGKLIMVQLKDDESGDSSWFFYDEKNEKFIPAELVEIDGKTYIKIKTGLEEVYGPDGKGGIGYRIYDPVSKKFISIEPENAENKKENMDTIAYIGIGACVLIVILAIIRLALRRKKKK